MVPNFVQNGLSDTFAKLLFSSTGGLDFFLKDINDRGHGRRFNAAASQRSPAIEAKEQISIGYGDAFSLLGSGAVANLDWNFFQRSGEFLGNLRDRPFHQSGELRFADTVWHR